MSRTSLAERVIAWHRMHGRKDLLWQRQATPYSVWVSEIMLQQTQVTTVIPYYQRFMTSFPTVTALADAPPDEVLHHWSGLGYYARARNLHKAARLVRDRHGGVFPEDYETIIELPGIGRSTAGAVLALALNKRHAILDGNVKRVLARFFAVDGPPGNTAVSKRLWELSEAETPDDDVSVYTQAIMDLGATVCTRSNPRCGACPLVSDCRAHAAGQQANYPGKREKKLRRRETTRMLLAVNPQVEVLLTRRPETGIWGGLWCLPEMGGSATVDAWFDEHLGCEATRVEEWPSFTHKFSHFDLDVTPVLARLDAAPSVVMDTDAWLWYNTRSPARLGLAAPVSDLLDQLHRRTES